jgi:hypothetical protein
LQSFEEKGSSFEAVLDAFEKEIVQLCETGIQSLVKLLQDLGVVDFLGEEVDDSRRSGAAVEEAEQLLAGVDILDVYVEEGILGSSIRLILELYCLRMSLEMSSAWSYATSTNASISDI